MHIKDYCIQETTEMNGGKFIVWQMFKLRMAKRHMMYGHQA